LTAFRVRASNLTSITSCRYGRPAAKPARRSAPGSSPPLALRQRRHQRRHRQRIDSSRDPHPTVPSEPYPPSSSLGLFRIACTRCKASGSSSVVFGCCQGSASRRLWGWAGVGIRGCLFMTFQISVTWDGTGLRRSLSQSHCQELSGVGALRRPELSCRISPRRRFLFFSKQLATVRPL
jgi:hypothetical protein